MTDDNSKTGWLDWIVDDLRGESAGSRRQFLQRSAATGAGAHALSVAGSNAALAQEAESDETTDVDVLNYALTLEHLEHAFYRDCLDQFGENDFGLEDVDDVIAVAGMLENTGISAYDGAISMVEDERVDRHRASCYRGERVLAPRTRLRLGPELPRGADETHPRSCCSPSSSSRRTA